MTEAMTAKEEALTEAIDARHRLIMRGATVPAVEATIAHARDHTLPVSSRLSAHQPFRYEFQSTILFVDNYQGVIDDFDDTGTVHFSPQSNSLVTSFYFLATPL